MGKASRKSEKTTKDKAAELRRQAESAQKRRERITKIGVGAGVVVVALGIIGVAAFASSQGDSTSVNPALATEDANAPLPQGVIPAGQDFAYGYPVGTPSSEDVPSLQVWEDFQCPACGAVEKLNGRGIKDLGLSGRAQVILRPTTFLDGMGGTEHSINITSAWGCAIDQNKGLEYHASIFENQPERQGDGISQERLIEIGAEVGITGPQLETFTQCVQDGTYRQWALNSTAIFNSENIDGTPTGVINGTERVKGQVLGDPVELDKALFGNDESQE